MKQDYTHEFYVTRKCTKYEYFTVRANSMEEAEWEAENGNEYFNFDWEEFDFDRLFDVHRTLIESRMYEQVYQGA